MRREAFANAERARVSLAHDAGRASALARQHLHAQQVTLDMLTRLAKERAARATASADQRMEAIGARISAHDPASVMARGWTMTLTTDGTVVQRADQLAQGDTIVTVFADGRASSSVTAVAPDDGTENEAGA